MSIGDNALLVYKTDREDGWIMGPRLVFTCKNCKTYRDALAELQTLLSSADVINRCIAEEHFEWMDDSVRWRCTFAGYRNYSLEYDITFFMKDGYVNEDGEGETEKELTLSYNMEFLHLWGTV